jgi:AcrR family transcriptional regulator
MKKFTERQLEIIKASIDLIANKGIQEVTIKNLSKKIGIAESAIYRHFDSKLDILLGILAQFRSNKMNALEQIQNSKVSEIEQLEMVFTERFEKFIADPSITAVVFSEEIFQNDNRLAEEVYAIMNFSQQMILRIVENGQVNKTIRNDIPAEQLSLTVIGALRLLVAKWRLSGFAFNLETEGEKLWLSIKQMIQK